ncbi:MAG TPA: bifunctional 5,10-methylene-tetrahydrofolate dehydrogenase/5,10-methylene-tetrahydrofolate cyclohydrolase, partial [Planctomycetaceae bacterium]|nr:bifunctional 5,10-methylene-tetrahydrofolate dehydrogenase/5,10-methylene-tetrahydrofolate cyclohydrolase [Planctomycetaceae bacterium]
MSAEIIDGKALAATFRGQIAEQVSQLKQEKNVVPHLTAVLVGDDPASAVYVRNKQRACEKAGIQSTLKRLSADTTEAELISIVESLNADSGVHGILVQLPLPKHINETAILDVVNPLKDVDAFHPENVGLIVQGRPRYLPCTPYGIQQMILSTKMETAGKHAVVLGRSEIVGKPMAMLLVQR